MYFINSYYFRDFTENTLRGKLGVNAIESKKSLYDLVVVDSWNTERPFAEELEKREDIVEVYTKLPRGFYINTPMAHHNPDWAIVFKEGVVKHIYFVAETKGASKYLVKSSNISGIEGAKMLFTGKRVLFFCPINKLKKYKK